MPRLLGISAGLLAGAVLFAPHAEATPGDELPDGEGRKILMAACTSCHDLSEVTKLRGFYTRAQWRDVVVTMKEYGAAVDEKEVDVLTDYLAQSLGKKTAAVAGQTPDRLSFEVVSIKANHNPTPFASLTFSPGGRLVGDDVTVYMLIAQTFGGGRPLMPTRLVGGPTWIRSDHFNIVAKTPDGTPLDEFALSKLRPGYLRGLLEDRFQLKYHWEVRSLPVATLALDRKDGRLGPQLHHRTDDCSVPSECDVTFGPGLLRSGGMTMQYLAETLSTALQRVVTDRTGLEGLFKVEVRYLPEGFRLNGFNRDQFPNIDPDGPAISDAIRDQLGLKLESTTGPVDVLVIDHVEHPEN